MAKVGIDIDASLSEKLDFFLEALYKNQESLGRVMSFHKFLHPLDHHFYGATDKNEMEFYVRCLLERGFLSRHKDDLQFEELKRPIVNGISFTEKGINHYLSFAETGINSKKCFVAMSFAKQHKWIFQDGILPALQETGFEDLKVDEDKTLKYRENENTINDFILFSIRASKFCIADYTGNRNGVYFETGYALAKGKQVIYTCKESEFKNVHFDTNRFPFITYQSGKELKEKLINRIRETLS
jgi:hypothetical protein